MDFAYGKFFFGRWLLGTWASNQPTFVGFYGWLLVVQKGLRVSVFYLYETSETLYLVMIKMTR